MRIRFLSVLIIMLSVGCSKPKPTQFRKIAGFTQGTTYHITYEDLANKDLTRPVDSLLKIFDLTFSEYIPNSMVS